MVCCWRFEGPFTEARAITSFTHYFKTKTGNKWEDRDNFVNKKKKYLLVEIEHDQQKVGTRVPVIE